MECPKCKKEIIDGITVVMPFKISGNGHIFYEECGRQFQELKDVLDEKYESDLMLQYFCFIERPQD